MRLHRQWKRAISFLTSVVMTTVSIVPGISPLTAYAAGENREDPSKVYVVGSDPATVLNENDPSKYNAGTYTAAYIEDDSKDHYAKKKFEWTDKDAGEGKITIETKLPVDSNPTTAVYAFTTCTGHGFGSDYDAYHTHYTTQPIYKDIAKANIEWLLDNYDKVDLIIVNQGNYGGIHIEENVTKDNYVSKLESTDNFTYGQHWNCSLYTGLYEYLFKERITADNYTSLNKVQKRFPTAIYVSFDNFYNGLLGAESNHHGIAVEAQKYPEAWPILKEYRDKGLYISSGLDDSGSSEKFCYYNTANVTNSREDFVASNIILALGNPSIYDPEANNWKMPEDRLWDGYQFYDKDHHTYEPNPYSSWLNTSRTSCYYVGNKYKVDYSYGESFEKQGAHAVGSIQISDLLSNVLEINGNGASAVSVTADPETGAKFDENEPVKILPDGTISVAVSEYVRDTVIKLEIPVKVDDNNLTDDHLNKWSNTNGNASVIIEQGDKPSTTINITSPKMHLEGTSLDTDAEGAGLVKKQVNAEGTAWAGQSGKEFSFSITPGTARYADGTKGKSPYGKNATKQDVKTKSVTMMEAGESGQQEVGFGTFYFTKPGTYEYTIKESTPTWTPVTGWTFDENEYTTKIVVTEAADGTLSAAAATPVPVFNNQYGPYGELDTKGKLILSKTVEAEGTAWADKEFEFSIAPHSDTPEAPLAKDTNGSEIRTASLTFSEAGTQTVDFGVIKYYKAGTYKYVMKETSPTGTKVNGWTYDNTEKTVTVTVVDNGDGTMTVTPDPEKQTITNKYVSEGTLDTNAVPILKKTVDAQGTQWASKKFKFKITPGVADYADGSDDGTSPYGKDKRGNDVTEATLTFSASDTKTVDFGTITFTKAGTYKYTLEEVIPTAADDTWKNGVTGWTFDTTQVSGTEIEIKVTDNGNGTMKVEAPDAVEITNKYVPEGTLITGEGFLNKTVNAPGTKWAPKTFKFTVAAVGNAPKPYKNGAEVTEGTATFSKAGTQKIDFGTITFNKAGTFKYTVTETTESGGGWTCDNDPKTVTVVTTDNGDGTLSVIVQQATIINKYEAGGSLDTLDKVIAKKVVEAEGSEWAKPDGKSFTFSIEGVNGAPLGKDRNDPRRDRYRFRYHHLHGIGTSREDL